MLGKILVRIDGEKLLSGLIVETEAYLGMIDEAAHSYLGKTKRNEVMFGDKGRAYIYFTYGNHYCVNVVTGNKDEAHAVLIRALEPLDGTELMKSNRKQNVLQNLTNGPGKLTQALKIDLYFNGIDLRSDELFISDNNNFPKFKIGKSRRIGITKNTEKLWRFYIQDNAYVSYYKKKLR